MSLRLPLLGFVCAAALVCLPSALSAPGNSFKVRSTLDGKTVLSHRIHWSGLPNMPAAKVQRVDFLIDGKSPGASRRRRTPSRTTAATSSPAGSTPASIVSSFARSRTTGRRRLTRSSRACWRPPQCPQHSREHGSARSPIPQLPQRPERKAIQPARSSHPGRGGSPSPFCPSGSGTSSPARTRPVHTTRRPERAGCSTTTGRPEQRPSPSKAQSQPIYSRTQTGSPAGGARPGARAADLQLVGERQHTHTYTQAARTRAESAASSGPGPGLEWASSEGDRWEPGLRGISCIELVLGAVGFGFAGRRVAVGLPVSLRPPTAGGGP